MATRIGLEPTTPSVTGWCSNQLSYRAILEQLLLLRYGAADEARTRYLHLGKVALYQMSYGRIYGASLHQAGPPRKLANARFCGEEEKVWRSSRQSCKQDCTMNSRTFDEATRIGLEPTTPSVTGWCSNQLSYRAIPEQLMLLLNGAADEARTRYLHLGKVALYQMSYGRILETRLGFLDWCLRSESNQ